MKKLTLFGHEVKVVDQPVVTGPIYLPNEQKVEVEGTSTPPVDIEVGNMDAMNIEQAVCLLQACRPFLETYENVSCIPGAKTEKPIAQAVDAWLTRITGDVHVAL